MTERKTGLLYRLGIAACVVSVLVLAVLWVTSIVRGFRAVQFEQNLAAAVERGDSRQVLALVGQFDPTGRGTAADWSGERTPRDASGFAWLLRNWREHGHTRGAAALFEWRSSVDPGYPREELLAHLRWLKGQADRESLEELFRVALRTDSEAAWTQDTEKAHPLFAFADGDPGLALLAWEAHHAGHTLPALPESLVNRAVAPSNFGNAENFERLLRLTGLLDPVESFVVRDNPSEQETTRGTSWIECLHNRLFRASLPGYQAAREQLEREPFATAGPEMPGIFLLQGLLRDSISTSQLEFSPSRIAPAVLVFERLRPEAKADVANLLDRHIPDWSGHEDLRDWVWTHHRSAWERQRDRYLALDESGIGSVWRSLELHRWLRTAAKHGQAGHTAPVARHLWTLRLAERAGMGQSNRYEEYQDHPFSLAVPGEMSLVSQEGAPLRRGHFELLLAYGGDPATPPSTWFPRAALMGYTKASDSKWRPPWHNATAEEFDELLTKFGEAFTEEKLRFLIVPCFLDLADNFSKTLPVPEELAKFQRLAAENDRPGGWLSKDLAEILPRWWIRSKEKHEALIAAGGRSYSYDRMNAYLRDRGTPISARVSYALGMLQWDLNWYLREVSIRIGAPLPSLPEIDELALEFALEFESGRWTPESIPHAAWKQIVEGWLHEASASPEDRAEGNRKEARRAILARLEPIVLAALAAAPPASQEAGRTELDPMLPLVSTYATLLRRDQRNKALASLWMEIERCMPRPREVFPWIPADIHDRKRIAAKIISEQILRRYREGGWPAVAGEIGAAEAPGTFASLSEATSSLNLQEWMEFCAEALDFKGSGVHAKERDEFFAIPPAAFFQSVRNAPKELRMRHIFDELAKIRPPAEHAAFFSIALPPIFRQFVGRREIAAAFLLDLESKGGAPLPPEVRLAITRSCDIHHLEALRDPAIPLAQRWAAAHHFLVVQTEDKSQIWRSLEEWPPIDRTLVETGIDLLLEAIDRGLPVWEIANRGFATPGSPPDHQPAAILSFVPLHRVDPEGQAGRVASLLRADTVTTMLKHSPDPKRLLEWLYWIALQAKDRAVAMDLFAEAESRLSFEEKLAWLRRGGFHAQVAGLFEREWRRVGELSSVFSYFASGDELEAILSALPPDPDLRLLVRITLAPRNISTQLVPRQSQPSSAISLLADKLLEHPFAKPEMERLCLAQFPGGVGQIPAFGPWLEKRLAGQAWPDLLKLDSPAIRKAWPFWARRIEMLAASGDFETLSGMLPEPRWFANRPRPFDDGYSGENEDTVEEMVWMGFARTVGRVLQSAPPEKRLAAGEIAAGLLASPPVSRSGGLDRPTSSANEAASGPWTFQTSSMRDLWFLALAATLAATLDEPAGEALARANRHSLPQILSNTRHPRSQRVPPPSHSGFVRVLAEFAESLTAAQRREFLLRACETGPFSQTLDARSLPCHSIVLQPLPSTGMSLPLVEEVAKARLEAKPDDARRMADVGLVLHRSGKREKALPLLQQALSSLTAKAPEDQYAIDQVSRCLGPMRRNPAAP